MKQTNCTTMDVDKNSPSEGDQNAASYVSDKQILQ